MAVGDRIQPSLGSGHTDAVSTDDTVDALGFKGAARIVQVGGTGTSATQVQGAAADGAAAVGSPVQIAGKDGSGNIQAIAVNTDGELVVNLEASTINIGDVDVLSVVPGTGATNLGKAEDAVHTTGDVGVMLLGVANTANANLSGTTLDYTPIATDLAGNVHTQDQGPGWTSAFGIAGVAVLSADMTTAAVVTSVPTSTMKLVITDIIVSVDTAMFVLFEEETSGTDLLKIFIPANGTVQITPRSKMKLATADKRLTADASVAGNIAITVFYYSEA